jgi:nucleotide-binding universal stress UspA family protein
MGLKEQRAGYWHKPDRLPVVALKEQTRTMSYAALMVHFDDHPNARRRARLAADLARRFDAVLIGIAGYSYLPSFLADGSAEDAGEAEDERQELAEHLVELEARFRVLAKHAGEVEWRGAIASANDLVPRAARAADLVIIGRKPNPKDFYYSLDPGLSILRAGRPVLLVPDETDSLQARRVVVAWKDTREARCAVRDALPFLKQAEKAMVVTVTESGTEIRAQQSVDDLAQFLLRHEVSVAAKTSLHARQSIAAELQRFASDEGADLIVAGGYGRSRLGEWVLGGVTRDLLSSSPVCCLLSH